MRQKTVSYDKVQKRGNLVFYDKAGCHMTPRGESYDTQTGVI